MVIYISTNDVKLQNNTYTLLKAIRSSGKKTFDDVIIDLLNQSINNNPTSFLKTCYNGGISIEIPGMSSFWSTPLNRGEIPRRIDLRKATLKYVIEEGVEE